VEGTTRVQAAPRPTGLAFDAPTKANPSLPDDPQQRVNPMGRRWQDSPAADVAGQAVKTPSGQ
jgi:hypothetical protein